MDTTALKTLKTFALPVDPDAAEAFMDAMALLSEDKGWEGDFHSDDSDWGYEDNGAERMFAKPEVYNDPDFRMLADEYLSEVE
jgi:hypothetical protein